MFLRDKDWAQVVKTNHFSTQMTSMLHTFPGSDEFQHRLQSAELDYVTGSRAGATALAENYVGLSDRLSADWRSDVSVALSMSTFLAKSLPWSKRPNTIQAAQRNNTRRGICAERRQNLKGKK